jgi:autotransporter passenger strand-loop-strand repeat protein
VLNGGHLDDDGTAYETTVNSGGSFSVQSGAWGHAFVSSGGVVRGSTIGGGMLELGSGATGSGMVDFASGGTLKLDGTGT